MHVSPLGVPATFDSCSLGTSPAADADERALEGEESEGRKVSSKGSGNADDVAGARGRHVALMRMIYSRRSKSPR